MPSMPSRRACVLLMDSLGIGASHDAAKYGDEGANTFGHIVKACRLGQADVPGLRSGPLHIPNLARLGLYHAAGLSSEDALPELENLDQPQGYYGYAVEQSLGKDTPSGHWELAGVPIRFEWGYFPESQPCFPKKLIQNLIQRANLPGVLGEKHASGTDILAELGDEHMKTGKPIVYTSADSVFQIAVYELCEIARELVDEYQIGRVIARPFNGTTGAFKRTGNRRDYSIPPPKKTLLDYLKQAGRDVIAIGKISDIYAHQGPTHVIKAHGNMALFDATCEAMKTAPAGSLVFTNFVDFDSSFGHRRDLPGYAAALEAFDARLPAFEESLKPGDAVVISADHGCDPTFPGSDHTREHVPVLFFGPGIPSQAIGKRASFADIGQSLAEYLAIDASMLDGMSFLKSSHLKAL